MPTFEECFASGEEHVLSFLVDDYGFQRIDRRTTDHGTNWFGCSVIYESARPTRHGIPPGWRVRLSFAAYRLELNLEVSDGTEPYYDVERLHQLEGRGEFPGLKRSLSTIREDAEAHAEEYARLAGVLRACGARFFSGDATLWADLRAQRERNHAEWQREMRDYEDRRTLAKSEEAFRAKDWARVVKLLEPLADRLTPAQATRMSYARKKLQAGS